MEETASLQRYSHPKEVEIPGNTAPVLYCVCGLVYSVHILHFGPWKDAFLFIALVYGVVVGKAITYPHCFQICSLVPPLQNPQSVLTQDSIPKD